MDIFYKVLLSIVSIFLVAASGFAFSFSNSAELETNNYFEVVSKMVIESNYNQEVIDEMIDDAAEKGHSLTITVYGTNVPGAMKYADIKLTYVYDVKLFGITIDKTKQKVL